MLKITVKATEEQRKALLSQPNSLLAKAMLAGESEAMTNNTLQAAISALGAVEVAPGRRV